MAIAVAAMTGFFIALYLLLHRLGVYGALVCGESGSCEAVQASSYSVFLGVPVPAWGVGWYAVVLAVALTGVQGRFVGAKWPDRWLLVLATGGVAFSVYLTAVELFILRAICRWCLASAVLTVVIFALAVAPELAHHRRAGPP